MRGKQFHLPFLHGSFDLPHFFSLSTFHSAGFQARSTNVHLFRCSVYLNSYRFDVGFPHFVCSSMRMAHAVTKMSCLFADCTLSHTCTSLITLLGFKHKNPQHMYDTRNSQNLQAKITKNLLASFASVFISIPPSVLYFNYIR